MCPAGDQAVRESVLRSPRRSASKHAAALRLSERSTRRILHDDLHFHPNKMVVAQELSEHDFVSRQRACETLHSNGKQFKKFFTIDDPKYESLEGCKFIGYKEYVFMYGGEYLIGRGKWNYNLWVFDTIRERWERKCVLPYPRRHFDTCIVGTKLFITGGTGTFRVTQENTFWYDFKNDKWSTQLRLPFFDRQLKCCCFSNKYFILSISNKCGYFLIDEDFGNWMKMPLNVDDSLLKNQSDFGLFTYEDKFYVKGKDLIEFTSTGDKITVSSVKNITNKDCDKMEITVCDDTVYTLYEYRLDNKETFSLERYHMKTGRIDFIFQDIDNDSIIEADGEQFKFSKTLKLFSFNHYSLVDTNEVINDSFNV
ncbi:unnamed protein product [Phaedon cochleariae]|uniref:Uncharacterized protein n=1 Tax=Phaedon cochleariae TaxID=80249 RepID=A0A9N9SCN6_PHACE|nr:unnamed protein product [Phaedon cochleariae]